MGFANEERQDAAVAVAAAVFHQDAHGALHLLLTGDSAALALPGDTVEAGQHPEDAARRALEAETGITAPERFVLAATHHGEAVTLLYGALLADDEAPELLPGAGLVPARWQAAAGLLEQPDRLAVDPELVLKAMIWVRPGLEAGPGLDQDTAAIRALYRERAHVLATIAALFPARIARNDPAQPELPVLYLHTPAGQISNHLHPDDLDLFGHVPTVSEDAADLAGAAVAEWDGHTKEEALLRWRKLAAVLSYYSTHGNSTNP